MRLDWENGALAEGLACYGRQEFFAAHEHWESVWLHLVGIEKTLLQALIHITVAFHHLQRENRTGATRQLTRALRKLDTLPAVCGDLEIERIRASVRDWLGAIESGTIPASPAFPRIR